MPLPIQHHDANDFSRHTPSARNMVPRRAASARGARKRMSAKQVQRTLRVSYKTAWYLCHRIRRAIARADRPMLHRTVQMQDTYVRGKTRGKSRPATLGDDEIRISIHPPGGGVGFGPKMS